MSEQRLTDELRNYWESLKQEKFLPNEAQINPDFIASIWPSCFLVKVKEGGFAFEYLGDEIMQAYEKDEVSSELIAEQLYPEKPGITFKFEEVVSKKEPVEYDGEFLDSQDMEIKFRKILLPIGDDEKVTHILGGMRWKVATGAFI